MAVVDFPEVRSLISISEVLDLLDYVPTQRTGEQLRGPCPVHGSASRRSRSFSVNLRKGVFQCFKCGASGNQLDLWVAVSGVTVYQAALELCDRLGVEVPRIERH